jgi:hypothetical protein
MPQIISTKNGVIEVERSWSDGPHHIALLTNGAYCHITGLPVRDKKELRDVLSGEELEKALHWFDHRHEEDTKASRRIILEPDGTPIFEDGTPVESPSDLYQFFKPGPVLDAAIKALVLKLEAREKAQKLAQTKAGKAARKLAGPKKGGGNQKKGAVTKVPFRPPEPPPGESAVITA